MESFPFRENSTTYQKVSAISCKYYYYCWIHIIDFSDPYYFVLCFKTVQQKNTEKQYLVIILLYRARYSEPQVNLRDELIVSNKFGLQLEIDRYSCK